MTVDDLGKYGMERMTDDAIRNFLSSQGVGVLALSSDDAPVMRPMSFGFDGDALYLLYVLGGESRKRELSDSAETARFLVYSAETAFNWRSVILTGTLSEVPDAEIEDIYEGLTLAWRPKLFETAAETEETALYRFDIDSWSGLKHAGLPPGFGG